MIPDLIKANDRNIKAGRPYADVLLFLCIKILIILQICLSIVFLRLSLFIIVGVAGDLFVELFYERLLLAVDNRLRFGAVIFGFLL